MAIIYKYPLGVEGNTTFITNPIIKFLDIKEQRGWPVLWAVVDDNFEKIKNWHWEIHCVGTGWPLDGLNVDNYLGTYIDLNGFVWHYFYDLVKD